MGGPWYEGVIVAAEAGTCGELMQPPIALIVDDETDFRSLLGEVLRADGYVVVDAPDGAQALHILDCVIPDVMILDLRMPIMSGWELYSAVEGRPELRDVPVVFLSAVPQSAPDGGALIVRKPFDLRRLGTLLKALHPAPRSEA
jgi:two-component system response regulator (stage 0 sporulation protein F)